MEHRQEYLYELKPNINTSEWSYAEQRIDTYIQRMQNKYSSLDKLSKQDLSALSYDKQNIQNSISLLDSYIERLNEGQNIGFLQIQSELSEALGQQPDYLENMVDIGFEMLTQMDKIIEILYTRDFTKEGDRESFARYKLDKAESVRQKTTNLSGNLKDLLSSLGDSDTVPTENKPNPQDNDGNKTSFKDIIKEVYDTYLSDKFPKLDKFDKGAAGRVAGIASDVTTLITLFKKSNEYVEKIAEYTGEQSNKFISDSSLFVDNQVRDTMAKFGLNSVQAQALNKAMDVTGIDTNDFGRLTSGQRELLTSLTQQYEDAINSIDPQKLEEFNKAGQQYQAIIAESTIRTEVATQQFMAESESMAKATRKMAEFRKQWTETIEAILENPIVNFVVDTVVEFFSTIVEFGTRLLEIVEGLNRFFSFGGGTTNNDNSTTTSNTTNNWYITGQGGAQTQQQLQHALASAGVLNG